MYDVVIIGAGVVGAMTARKLSAYKLKVCVVEKEHDVSMGATRANSAIVHAGFDAKEGSLKAKLNVIGSEMMPNIASELGVKYKNNGSIVIGFDENDKIIIQELYERGIKNGVKGIEIVDQKRLKELEPNISEKAVCALYAPSGAIVCPYELTVAAVGNAMDNGVELKLDFEVIEIRKSEASWEIISDNETVSAKYIVNAAGLYADEIAEMAGDSTFEIHPRKGEYILLDKECGNLVSHTVFRTPGKMGKGILVSPTVDGNLLAGPTSEDIDDKENKNTTDKGFGDIISQTMQNVSGVMFNKTITSFCGLRAAGNTGDFIINSPFKGFINAAGIESPGLSASPAIAEYIFDLLKEQGLVLIPDESYNPVRKPMHAFSQAGIEERNEMIKKNSAYGRIICRCEGVTEGEILDALRTNPKARDLDGVKRRTRAQMGRCQGGFCSPYIVGLISKELDIPYENVTKFGGNSYVNSGKTKQADK